MLLFNVVVLGPSSAGKEETVVRVIGVAAVVDVVVGGVVIDVGVVGIAYLVLLFLIQEPLF